MVWNPVSPKLANIETFRAWLTQELADFAGLPPAIVTEASRAA